MPPADREGLILDAYNLAKAGRLSPARVVELLACCVNDDDANVWDAVGDVLVALDKLLIDEPSIYDHFAGFAAKLIAKISASVGWEAKPSDGFLTKLLRANLVGLLGRCVSPPQQTRKKERRKEKRESGGRLRG